MSLNETKVLNLVFGRISYLELRAGTRLRVEMREQREKSNTPAAVQCFVFSSHPLQPYFSPTGQGGAAAGYTTRHTKETQASVRDLK